LISLICSYLLFTLLTFVGYLLIPQMRGESSGVFETLMAASGAIFFAPAGYYFVFWSDFVAYWDALLALTVAVLASSWILRWRSTIRAITAQSTLLVLVEFYGAWTFFRVFSDAMATMD
jgi:hypothetical protein